MPHRYEKRTEAHLTLGNYRTQTPAARDYIRDLVSPAAAEDRPKTRADCVEGPRPCPWMGCRYHLGLDEMASGSLRVNFAHLDVDEIPETCSLDRADRGVTTLNEIGVIMNLHRERVRQIERRGLARYRLKILENG